MTELRDQLTETVTALDGDNAPLPVPTSKVSP